MSGKYYLNGKDITTLAEPRITSWSGTTTNFSTYFQGDDTAINALHKGGSDTSNINNYIPLSFNYNGSPISFTKRGFLPTTLHKFGEITKPGFWYVERTDAGIYFKNANGGTDYSYPASIFRNGYAPHEILVIFVAGGGGGGGWGYYDSNGSEKNGELVEIVGGAGGGGGVYAARVVINDYSGNGTWQCGAGGAAGGNGSTSVESTGSTGGTGGTGGASGIYINGGELIGCVAKGGNGGRGGVGNSNGTGTPGNGGTGGTGSGGYCDRVATMSGGDGNNYNNITRTTTSGMIGVYVTEGTGSPMVNLLESKHNNSTTENTKSNGNSGAYFSGGCSWGYGVYGPGGGNGGAGGGGGSGKIKSAGNNGAIYLYY